MTELTIPARLVDEGVGLPRMWWDGACVSWNCNELWLHTPDETLDLTDPQTAFGVALRLDEWERARANGVKPWALVLLEAHGWSGHAPWSSEHRTRALHGMVARLTRIGMDHAIRRALGWEVKPGTLAELRRSTVSPFDYDDGPGWKMKAGNASHFFWEEGSDTLPGITDPTEALQAIYEEVTNG